MLYYECEYTYEKAACFSHFQGPSIRLSKAYFFDLDLALFFSPPPLADEERSLSAPSPSLSSCASVSGGSADSLCLADLLVGADSFVWVLTAFAFGLGFFLGASRSSSSDSSSFGGLKVSILRFTALCPVVVLLASGCCVVLASSVSCRRLSDEAAFAKVFSFPFFLVFGGPGGSSSASFTFGLTTSRASFFSLSAFAPAVVRSKKSDTLVSHLSACFILACNVH